MLFDSHCHLTAEAFDPDRDAVLDRAASAGVDRLVTIASAPDDSREGVELARRRSGVWTTAGFHPHEASTARGRWWEEVRELLDLDEVVAVGECGLDFHYEHAPRDVQRDVFLRHVELADEAGLPLVIHSRSADEDMTAILRDVPSGVRGVLHCFTGGDALLDAALEKGFHVSFTGIVSFRRFGAAHQVRRVPEARLMVETDAPYLAPVPYRGQRNEPARVVEVARAVAGHRERTFEEVARSSTANALTFYGLEPEAPTLA